MTGEWPDQSRQCHIPYIIIAMLSSLVIMT